MQYQCQCQRVGNGAARDNRCERPTQTAEQMLLAVWLLQSNALSETGIA
jgi:hypothetical protein